jgi:erythromycin esterase-like protein
MSKLRIILTFSLIITTVLFYYSHNHNSVNIDSEIAEIKYYANVIRSIDPVDTTFADLNFLMSSLHDKRIVCLGEESHYKGEAHLAKSRLIKFLHERMNFDVILYEAGMYDMWQMTENAKVIGDIKPSEGLYYFWGDTKECENIWNYYKRNKDIQLGGFDIQITGTLGDSIRIGRLGTYLERHHIDIKKFPALNNERELAMSIAFAHILKENARELWNNLDSLTHLLSKHKHDNIDDKIYFRYLCGLKENLNYAMKHPAGTPPRLHIRDSLMADNFIFLADSVFPHKKIIVWAANMHIVTQNNAFITQYDNLTYVPMGAYLKSKYGDRLYVICFDSYADRNDEGSLMNKNSCKTIEFMFHQSGYRYAFLDFEMVASTSFLKNNFASGLNHRIPYVGTWSKMTDALFFIDTLSNITPLK